MTVLAWLHEVAETIGGFSTALALVAVIVAILAHRKTSRDKAIEVILEWTRHLSTIDAVLLNLARQLENHGTDEQIKSLAKREPFILNSSQADIFKQGILRHITEVTEGQTATLRVESAGSVQIRAVVVSYLNMLEYAVAAARYTSADTEIIHDQFEGLYNPKTRKAVFQRFRNVSESGAKYPSIALFEDELRKKYDSLSDPIHQTERLRRRLLSTFEPIDRQDVEELKSNMVDKLKQFKKWSDVAASISLLRQLGAVIDSEDLQRKWAKDSPLTDVNSTLDSGLINDEAISILRGRLRIRDSLSALPEILRGVLTGEKNASVLCKGFWLSEECLAETLLKVDFQEIVYLLREIWLLTETPSSRVDLQSFRRSLAGALVRLESGHPSQKLRTIFVRTGRWTSSADERRVPARVDGCPESAVEARAN